MCVLYNSLRGTREKFVFLGVIVSPAARKLIGVPVRGKCNLGPGPSVRQQAQMGEQIKVS